MPPSADAPMAMAIISGLAAILGRFAGKILNTLLGWATILLFGRMSGRRQTLLLLIALAALVWVVLVVGVLVPDVGTILLAFVPVPDLVSEDLVRLAMLAGALILPGLVGVAIIALTDRGERGHGLGLIVTVARGYLLTPILALTMILLAGVAIVRRLHSLARRREDAHVAVIIKPDGYRAVVDQLRAVLAKGGLPLEPRPASMALSAPPRWLAAVAGQGFKSLLPDRLVQLSSTELDVLVYPSDVAISGPKALVARARTLIATELTDAPAYMTTSEEAQAAEDELRQAAALEAMGAFENARARLRSVEATLLTTTIPFDDWETLYRQRLQLDRRLANPAERAVDGDRATAIVRSSPGREAVTGSSTANARSPDEGRIGAESPPGRLWQAVIWAGLVFVATDLVLALLERLRTPSVRV